jgi:hypothetical protein
MTDNGWGAAFIAGVFHTVEIFRPFFHTMENCSAIFPRYGKLFAGFSTPWKKVFHSVENDRRGRCEAVEAESGQPVIRLL